MMQIEDTVVGDGPEAKEGDQLELHYTGMFTDGEKFDSSLDRNQTFMVTLGVTSLIQGFTMGLYGIKKGGKRTLHIPSEMGYGERGAGHVIPPHTDLVFEIECVDLIPC
ncbi:MAG: FKBP-type peptidyl-prolyl cis-trans isomerase [Armatimonadetes bacterium]|nr:FKBP-type peptidyl-prolyl cis-trans isomerase [Armatimonadota bacterium]